MVVKKDCTESTRIEILRWLLGTNVCIYPGKRYINHSKAQSDFYVSINDSNTSNRWISWDIVNSLYINYSYIKPVSVYKEGVGHNPLSYEFYRITRLGIMAIFRHKSCTVHDKTKIIPLLNELVYSSREGKSALGTEITRLKGVTRELERRCNSMECEIEHNTTKIKRLLEQFETVVTACDNVDVFGLHLPESVYKLIALARGFKSKISKPNVS